MSSKDYRSSRRNPVLVPGVHRFGRSKMYHKRGINFKRTLETAKKVVVKKPVYTEKIVGGAQNGGKRLVQLKKSKRYHPTASSKVGRRANRNVVTRPPKLRSSLIPGTILILVAGRHAGKRVVFLKQLSSGLLLVTGPFKLNGVPLRRVHQQYVIATSTKVDMANVTVGLTFNDLYFRRDKKSLRKRRQQQEGNIFASDKPDYMPSDGRKTDQNEMDKQVLNAVKSSAEKKHLLKYLASSFSLKNGQYPHKMNF